MKRGQIVCRLPWAVEQIVDPYPSQGYNHLIGLDKFLSPENFCSERCRGRGSAGIAVLAR